MKTEVENDHFYLKFEAPGQAPFKNSVEIQNNEFAENTMSRAKIVRKDKTKKDTKSIFICDICNRQLLSKNTLKKHKKTIHDPKWMNHQCDICGKKYSTIYNLGAHKRLYHSKTSISCPYCTWTFRAKHHLNIHKINRHSTVGPFKCDQCPKTFAYKYLLDKHTSTHSENNICKLCNKKLVNADTLRRHMKRIHLSEAEKKYVCEICAKRFAYKDLLTMHMNIHRKRYFCHKCQKGFKDSFKLHKHRQTFICKYGSSQGDLQLHTSNFKSYECDDCKVEFNQYYHLYKHIRRYHSSNYICDYCSRRYRLKANIKSHLLNSNCIKGPKKKKI